jgi:hypothetical protein
LSAIHIKKICYIYSAFEVAIIENIVLKVGSDICKMPVKPSLITTVHCVLFVLTKEGRIRGTEGRDREGNGTTGHQE